MQGYDSTSHVEAQPHPTRANESQQPPRDSSTVCAPNARTVAHLHHSQARHFKHLSPRKFQQLQQQHRQVVLRAAQSLSPLAARVPGDDLSPCKPPTTATQPLAGRDPVPWNPGWIPIPKAPPPSPARRRLTAPQKISYGSMSLNSWLDAYEKDLPHFESLEKFVQVKIPEALAFSDKIQRQIDAEHSTTRHGRMRTRRGRHLPKAGRGQEGALLDIPTHDQSPACFRIAVFSHVLERSLFLMAQSAPLAHLAPLINQARLELLRAIFSDFDRSCHSVTRSRHRASSSNSDSSGSSSNHSSQSIDSGSESSYDHDEMRATGKEQENVQHSMGEKTKGMQDRPLTQRARHRRHKGGVRPPKADEPHSLGFFLALTPFSLKLQEETYRRKTHFERHQVVLRRIVQTFFRSLGSVFQAWKLYVRRKKDERMHDKAAQLSAMVVVQRGRLRAIFIEWSKCSLVGKFRRLQEHTIALQTGHDERVNDLQRELFLLREHNTRLQEQLLLTTTTTVLQTVTSESLDHAESAITYRAPPDRALTVLEEEDVVNEDSSKAVE